MAKLEELKAACAAARKSADAAAYAYAAELKRLQGA